MSDKMFRRLLALICAAGLLTTSLLIGHTAILKDNCSIIAYIAGEER